MAETIDRGHGVTASEIFAAPPRHTCGRCRMTLRVVARPADVDEVVVCSERGCRLRLWCADCDARGVAVVGVAPEDLAAARAGRRGRGG